MVVAQRSAGAELTSVRLKSLIALSAAAAGLTLKRGAIRSAHSGGYASRFKGRGMEFDETRLYQPGDDIRTIDWRVTARTGKAHTKIFREERERPVFISVDNRPAMHFATRGVFKSVLAAKLAALLAWASKFHGDKIGGQIFDDRICQEIKPQNGKHAVLRFLNGLVHPVGGANQKAVTLDYAWTRLSQHTRPGSLVFIISDFRGIDDKAESHLAKLSEHCDVVLIFIYDLLEQSLPEKGRHRLTDSRTDVIVDSRDRLRSAAYRQRFDRRLLHVRQIAKKMRLVLLVGCTTDDPIQLLRMPLQAFGHGSWRT